MIHPTAIVSTKANLGEFVAAVFGALHLDWHDHVISDARLLRPSEIMISCGNPSLAEKKLDWRAKLKMCDVVAWIISAERGKHCNNSTLQQSDS